MTGLFLLVAAAMFLAAGFFLVTSLLAAFSPAEISGGVDELRVTPKRQALLDKKASLLLSLKDASFDHEAGKLSDEDFEMLNTQLRDEAKKVLKELDADLEPFMGEAEALFSAYLADGNTSASMETGEPNESQASLDKKTCPSCGADNDLDAVFCKACAEPFKEEEDLEEAAAPPALDEGESE